MNHMNPHSHQLLIYVCERIHGIMLDNKYVMYWFNQPTMYHKHMMCDSSIAELCLSQVIQSQISDILTQQAL